MQDHIKVFELMLNLSLISNKAQNLFSVMSSLMNTVSITNVKIFSNERDEYKL